jgi:hypothetical protein
MKEIEMFEEFFCSLGELCFKIYMVERPMCVFDFVTLENQAINKDYFNEIKERHPNVIKGFPLSMRQWGEGVQIFLTDTFGIIVEYITFDHGEKIEKTVKYASLAEARKDKPSFINYLTKAWDPFEDCK